MTDTNSLVKTGWQLTIVVLSAGLMAFNINTFVHAGGLIPGGFTGLTLLTQEIGLRYLNVQIPFSVVLYALNVIPAILCFRHVGKKFVLYSVLSVFLCGLFTDCMPRMFIDFIQLHDPLLSAVFGGMLNGFAILLCLRVDLSTGGSDFIAIYFSEKYRQNTWNYILVGNSVILVIAGSLFGIERALYSIVFQFSTTVVLNSLYHAYQQKTMLIVTDHPNEIYAMIVENTHHGATLLAGKGLLRLRDHGVIYVVVHANEVSMLINAIRKIDSDSFVNVIATEHLNGRFFAKPKD